MYIAVLLLALNAFGLSRAQPRPAGVQALFASLTAHSKPHTSLVSTLQMLAVANPEGHARAILCFQFSPSVEAESSDAIMSPLHLDGELALRLAEAYIAEVPNSSEALTVCIFSIS